jgi:hypothetical protein
MVRRLVACLIVLSSILSAGIIIEVSEGAGPGDPPPPVPTSIFSLPFSLTLVPGNVGSSNSCEDSGSLNANCWYKNDSGQDWSQLVLFFQSDGDDNCGGDVFADCGITTQGTTTIVNFLGGTLPAGDDFYLVVSGAPEGTVVTLAAVPEPGTWAVAAMGLCCCGVLRWRRRATGRRSD